jgi:hypothetical protein
MGATDLVGVFRVLASRDSSIGLRGDREWAAQTLLLEMKQWAPATIWKAHGRSLRRLGSEEVDCLISDAVQALALATSSTDVSFRGSSEESARAWCRRVLVNHVSTELRRRRVQSELDGEELAELSYVEPEASPERDPVTTPESQSARFELARAMVVLRTVRARLFSTHRPRDAESTMRAVFCYIAYLSGATVEEQIRALSSESPADDRQQPSDGLERRRRNRVYKLRERGRKALNELLVLVDR